MNKEYIQPSMKATKMRIRTSLMAGSTSSNLPADKPVNVMRTNLTGNDAIKVGLIEDFLEGR